MEVFADKLKTLIDTRGVSLRALGRRIGVTHVTISRWLAGKAAPTEENLIALANYFGVDPEEMRDDQVLLPTEGMSQAASSRMLSIPVLDLSTDSSTPQQATFVKMLRVDRAWLYAQAVSTMNPEALHIISATSDNMSPLINAGDFVLVDPSQNAFITDGVYAMRYQGAVFIKRVQVLPSGRLNLISDNTRYSAFEVSSSDSIEVLGRCVLAFVSVKL